MDLLDPSAPTDFLERPLLRIMAKALADIPGEARQDALDFLAVIAGLKPVCLAGRGCADERSAALLHRLAASAGLPAHVGAGWEPLGDLPAWYLAASAKRRARREFVYICVDEATRQDVAAQCAKGRVTPSEEAALLSYPLCCVAEHHRRTVMIEQLYIAWAGGDVAHATRLIEAGIEPRPRSAADWARLEALSAITPAAHTSVNMCAHCAASDDSPAARMSRRYRDLALGSGWN